MTTEVGRAAQCLGDPEPPGIVVPYGAASGEQAFSAWAQILEPVFEVQIRVEAVPEFQFGFASWTLGTAVIGKCIASGHAFERSSRTIARSGIDHVMIQVQNRGGLFADVAGKTVQGRPGDICIFDLARPVSTISPDFRNTTLVIPRSVLAPLVADYDNLHGSVLAAEAPRTRLLRSHMNELARQLPDMTRKEVAGIADPTVNLAAGCLGASPENAEFITPAIDHARLCTIKAYIDRHLGDPMLDVDFICKHLGLSRSRLYRLFEQSGGIAAHIRRRRLSQCLRELTSPRGRADRISEIAYRWGFTNEASFSRAFRIAFGMSPSDARSAVDLRFSRRKDDADRSSREGAALADWMLDLMQI